MSPVAVSPLPPVKGNSTSHLIAEMSGGAIQLGDLG